MTIDTPGDPAGMSPPEADGPVLRLLRRLYRLLRFTEPIGIIIAATALILDVQARDEARVVSAWQLLTTRAPGNSGKVDALEYLNGGRWFGWGAPRASLRGIDLSPPSDKTLGAYLANARLRNADLSGAILDAADLSGADLSGGDLTGISLNGATLAHVNFRGATVLGDFAGAVISDSDLRPAKPSALTSLAGDDVQVSDSRLGGGVELRGSGDTLIWVDVSGTAILPEKSGNGPVGVVWALRGAPAKLLPATLVYFECDKAPEDADKWVRHYLGPTMSPEVRYAGVRDYAKGLPQAFQSCAQKLAPQGKTG